MRNKRSSLFILLFMTAHFFHHLLTSIIVPLLPMIRDSFSLTYAQAGGVTSAFTIAYGLAQLPSGWIADRVGARYLLFAGISGVAVAGAMVGLTTTYTGLLVCLALMGIVGGGYHPAAAPLVSASVVPSQRGKALGMHIVGGSGSHLVSPLAAVFIAGLISWRGSFLAISIPVFIFGIMLFIMLKVYHISARQQKNSSGEEEIADEYERRPSAEIIVFLVVSSAIGAVLGSTIAFVPLFGVDGLGVSQGASAVFLSLYFLTGMISAPLGGGLVDKLGSRFVFILLSILSGPIIILLGFASNWVLLALIMIFMGAIMFTRMVVSETYFVSHVSWKWRSTILGIYYFAGMEGSGVLTPVLGWAIDIWGFTVSFAAMGVLLSAISMASLAVLSASGRKSSAT